MVNECMQLCTRNACDGRARTCAGTAFEKAHVRMKRIYITCNGKYTENCWAETETSQKELAGLHRLVFQVAFGLLLAFYNREKPI